MSDVEKKDPRHLSRLLATQYLFTNRKIEETGLPLQVFEPNFLLHVLEQKKYDNKLYAQLIEGVEENKEIIDAMITQKAPEWPLDKINPIDLIILRIAIYEAFITNITPYKVAINEAIEVDKALSSKSSSGFINGVLGAIFKDQKESPSNE